MPKQITAIVPTFNRAKYLHDCIGGIMQQTRPVDEIIVWDDGSQDDTPDILAKIDTEFPNVLRVFRADNRGKSRALNQALQQARGDYIWICDDDDVACQGAIEALSNPLDAGRAAMSAGRHLRFCDDPKTGEKLMMDTGYWPDLSTGSVLRHMLEDIFFFQNASLVRRETFAKTGPFDEDLARSIDYDMMIRIALRVPIEMVDGIMFHQRKHDGPRGPSSSQHAAAKSEHVWAQADRQIFAKLRNEVPLDLYSSLFETDDPVLAQRAGLLQRACTYARKLDWDTALDDLNTAADQLPDTPLTEEERKIMRRMMSAKHGSHDAFAPPVSPALKSIARHSTAGASMLNGIVRGSIWRLRQALAQGRTADGFRIARFLAPALATPSKLHPSQIRERTTLPQNAYLV